MFRRLSHRFLASTAASASVAGSLSYNAKFVACSEGVERQKSKKMDGNNMQRTLSKKLDKSVDLADFELFHAYQVQFSEDATQPLSKSDLKQILLHCGILDPVITDFLFNSLVAMDKKKQMKTGKKAKASTEEAKPLAEGDEQMVSFTTFKNLCNTFAQGEEAAKWEIMFDFMDPDKSGLADKNEISTAVRHLLWCQTNWYGEDILYDGPFDLDLYFEVPTEAIAQLKANRFAHEMVMSCHGGTRQLAVNQKQFLQWMATGGKRVETLKGLFSVFGAYQAPDFFQEDE